MTTRRQLVSASAALALCSLVSPATSAGVRELPGVTLLGARFSVHDSVDRLFLVTLSRIETGSDPAIERYTLSFDAPPRPAVSAGTFRFVHCDSGRGVPLYVEPSVEQGAGRLLQAEICLLPGTEHLCEGLQPLLRLLRVST